MRSDKPTDQHQAKRGCGCTEHMKRLHNDVGKALLVVLTCLWHLNLPFRSHDLPQVTEFKVQGKKKDMPMYIIVLHFKINITVAMHVLQRLVHISGHNNAYVMIPNVECV